MSIELCSRFGIYGNAMEIQHWYVMTIGAHLSNVATLFAGERQQNILYHKVHIRPTDQCCAGSHVVFSRHDLPRLADTDAEFLPLPLKINTTFD